MEKPEPQIIILCPYFGGTVQELVASTAIFMDAIKSFENVIIHTDIQATAGMFKDLQPEHLSCKKNRIRNISNFNKERIYRYP